MNPLVIGPSRAHAARAFALTDRRNVLTQALAKSKGHSTPVLYDGYGRTLPAVEKRSGTTTDKDGWFYELLSGRLERDSYKPNESTAMGLSAYFAAVRAISQDIAKQPKGVYERLPSGGSNPLPAHPLWPILHDEPHPDYSAFDFWEAITAHALGFRAGYAEIIRDAAGVVDSLWLLDPTSVSPTRETGRLTYKVRGNSGYTFIAPMDMFVIHDLGYDAVSGYSRARLGRDSLAVPYNAQKFSGKFFENGVISPGSLEFPNALSEEAFKHLKESFEERHAGTDNAWKPMIVEEGGKWNQSNADPQKSQMIEAMNAGVEEVCRWFRIQPHKLFKMDKSSYNTLFEENVAYVTDTLMPWNSKIEHECNRKLFIKAERGRLFVKLNERALLRGNLNDQANFYEKMKNNGIYNADEIRALMDENPLPDDLGKAYFVQGNLVPLDIAVKGPQDPSAQLKTNKALQADAQDEPPATENAPNEPDTVQNAAPKRHLGALKQAHARWLASVLRRSDTVQADRTAKAERRQAPKEWHEQFAIEHTDTLEAQLADVLTAHSEACVLTFQGRYLSESDGQWLKNLCKGTAKGHVEMNLSTAEPALDAELLAEAETILESIERIAGAMT